jgi:hypothetical protein
MMHRGQATRNIAPVAPQMEVNNGDPDPPLTTLGAGSADTFRVEFIPTSHHKRFGAFQLYVGGIPIGDGGTTALYPHYMDLCRLSTLAEQPRLQERERLHLGDTFDHLDMYVEMTALDVVFTFTTRPKSEWGEPPPWAPPVGRWMRLSVARSEFISTWRQAEPQFRPLVVRQ